MARASNGPAEACPSVPNVEFDSEAQSLPTHEHDVSKGRGTSGLRASASSDFSGSPHNKVIRISLGLLTTSGRAGLGKLLAYARVEAFDNERPLSFCSEIAAKPKNGLALFQLVVLSYPARCLRGCRQTPDPN